MTNLVFIHGVNTRSTPEYLAEVKVRDQLFKDVVLGGSGTVVNSAWGDIVDIWGWNQASLPTRADRKQDQAFALGKGLAAKPAAGANPVADFARKSPQETIDELFIHLADRAVQEGRELNDTELADFKAATAYLKTVDETAGAAPFNATSDQLFGAELKARLDKGDASFGLADRFQKLVKDFGDRAGNAASQAVIDLGRDGLNDRIGRFLGDVFTYLQDDGANRKKIRDEVIKTLAKGVSPGQKLVVVGHSMGGIILVDLLSDPAKPLGALKIDLLVTVGSQVGVFEEMKLYAGSSPNFSAAKGNKAPGLANVGRWLNVYDPVDVLSFRCSEIFDDVEDFVFSSTTTLMDAHTAYFKRPSFHARLAKRLGS